MDVSTRNKCPQYLPLIPQKSLLHHQHSLGQTRSREARVSSVKVGPQRPQANHGIVLVSSTDQAMIACGERERLYLCDVSPSSCVVPAIVMCSKSSGGLGFGRIGRAAAVSSPRYALSLLLKSNRVPSNLLSCRANNAFQPQLHVVPPMHSVRQLDIPSPASSSSSHHFFTVMMYSFKR